MNALAVLLGVWILGIELHRCARRGSITCALMYACFNFAFLHIWIIQDMFGTPHDVVEPRVLWCVIMADAAWLLVTCLVRPGGIALQAVRQHDLDVRAVLVFFCLVYAVGVLYLIQVGASIFSADIEWARHTAKKGHGYYNIFITRGALLAAVFYYILYRMGRVPRWMMRAVVVSVLALQVATGFRTYVITTMLSLWICHVSISQYRLAKVLLAAMVALFLFVVVTAYKSGLLFTGGGVMGLLDDIWPYVDHRIVMEVPRITMRILGLIDSQGVVYGLTYWWDFLSALPGPGYSFGDRLFIWFATGQEIAGIAPIPPGLLGELVMNFGMASVPVGVALVSWIIRRLDSHPSTSMLTLAVKSILCICVAEVIYLGVGVIMTSRVLPLLAFVLLYIGIRWFMSITRGYRIVLTHR